MLMKVAGLSQPPGWDVTDSYFHTAGEPPDKIAALLVLDIQHLLVHRLHGCDMWSLNMDGRVEGSHQLLGIEHLLSVLRLRQGLALRRPQLVRNNNSRVVVLSGRVRGGRSRVIQGCQLQGHEPLVCSSAPTRHCYILEIPELVPPAWTLS